MKDCKALKPFSTAKQLTRHYDSAHTEEELLKDPSISNYI
jgi:hypothetical protein